jgi:ribosome-associated heat shock protein Hsp15
VARIFDARSRPVIRDSAAPRYRLEASRALGLKARPHDTVGRLMDTMPAMRIDKWLWAARFFKTRSQAAGACAGGKVDVNGDAAKPARLVRVGDLVHVTLPAGRRIARVQGLSERRGPPAEARALIEDVTPPAPPAARRLPVAVRPPGAGRPTKRERRSLDRLRGA